MLDVVRKEFIKYVKKFDLKDENVMKKFHHSFRVMDFCIEIAKSLNLSKEDIELAAIIGLLHDIGRFEQWAKYKTYSDPISTDHGDLGVKVLLDNNYIDNFIEDDVKKNIILIAIKNHNKYEIEKGLTEKQLLMSKIVKDADKLDILKEQGNELVKNIDKIDKKIILNFDEERQYNDNAEKEEYIHIFRMLLFIYDINFEYSFDYLLKNKIIENKIHLLKCYSEEDELLDMVQNKLLTYIYKFLKN